MKNYAGIILATMLASGFDGVAAEELLAAKNIRAGAVITASDIVTPKSDAGLRSAMKLVGMEAARSVYKGQPLSDSDLRTATIVERNAIVQMEFKKGSMLIVAEGRALDKGGMGDRIRVMNLLSRRVVSAVVVNENTVKTSL